MQMCIQVTVSMGFQAKNIGFLCPKREAVVSRVIHKRFILFLAVLIMALVFVQYGIKLMNNNMIREDTY